MNPAAFWAPLGLAAGVALALATAPVSEPVKACCRGGMNAKVTAETADAAPAVALAPDSNALAAALGHAAPASIALPLASAGSLSGSFRIGVVIYSFEQGKRSKAMAKALADKSLQVAGTDFAAAVKAGDPDSDADYGTFAPHSFDPDVESAIVAIPPGQVGGPIETSRGYWVVKRIK